MAKLVETNKDEFIQKEQSNFAKQTGKETVADILVEDLSTQEAVDNFVLGIIPEQFVKDYKKMKKLQDNLSKTEDEIKTKLLKMFEEHPEMNGKTVSRDGLTFTYTASYVRNSVDGKKLQEEHPDIYKKMLKQTNVKSTIKTSIKY